MLIAVEPLSTKSIDLLDSPSSTPKDLTNLT